MKIVIGMGHPAHFHLFKNVIDNLIINKIEYLVVIQQKDILEELLKLSGFNYTKILIRGNPSLISRIGKYLKSLYTLHKTIHHFSPDIMIGSISQLAHIGFFNGIKTYFTAEDDFRYTWVQGLLTYPFITRILAPTATNVGPFAYKKTEYKGYHKLAYLHPDHFTPDESKIDRSLVGERFIIIRLVSFNAYHDINHRGISKEDLHILIPYLEKYSKVFISSEKALPQEFAQYALTINPLDIHHYLYFADLFMGDSQSMAIEASLLGTPSVRVNSFYNKISVIDEIENKYQLTFSYPPNLIKHVIKDLEKILILPKSIFHERRDKLLADKINTTQYLTKFIISHQK